MYTESEAKEKWCPQMIQLDSELVNCIASLCMAWRPSYPKTNENGELIPAGYCGLAGEPKR